MTTTTNKIISSILIALLLLIDIYASADISSEGKIQIARFSEMSLSKWKNKSFEGKTQYSLKENGQNSYLQANSMQSASALYKKVKINIDETPYLNWCWRVDQALPELDEKTKTGDDYAARIYVVFKTGYTPLSTKALNYVWSSNNTTDKYWPNPFTEKAIMIPLRSKQDKAGTWQHEKVNIKEDLKQYFKKLPIYIDGVAIMTDTDNSQGKASASYGDIYFSKQ
jgi:hypothetical protein